MSETPFLSLFLSPAEAAKLLGLSIGTIRNRVRDGQIRSVLLGRRRLIPRSELERLAAVAAMGKR